MEALRKRTVVREDGTVTIGGLPYRKGDRLDVILLKQARGRRRRGMTARDLLDSGLVGLWAEREDISDSSQFARELREKAQTRGDRK